MAATEFSATNYIAHHLTHYTVTLFGSTIHLDTVVMSFVLGLAAVLLLRSAAARATAGVPGKWQAAVELLVEFVDGQVRSVYPGSRAFVGPFALTVFVWVLLMNAMDFLPVDVVAQGTHLFAPEWRIVPTADMNTTFALALSVFGLMIFFHIKVKGLGGWIHELFTSPFGSNPLLWPFNFIFQLVEYISKPLSHSLRLYGNLYAGEILFLLLWVWAASGVAGVIFGGILAVGWAIFHILIVVLQAFLFMILAAVYIAMAHEHH